jgi:hypothetical protein
MAPLPAPALLPGPVPAVQSAVAAPRRLDLAGGPATANGVANRAGYGQCVLQVRTSPAGSGFRDGLRPILAAENQ